MVPSSLLHVAEGFPYPLVDSEDAELSQQGPLRVDGWEKWMKSHPDQYFTATLGGILRKGAKIGYVGPTLDHRNRNHLLAISVPNILTADL